MSLTSPFTQGTVFGVVRKGEELAAGGQCWRSQQDLLVTDLLEEPLEAIEGLIHPTDCCSLHSKGPREDQELEASRDYAVQPCLWETKYNKRERVIIFQSSGEPLRNSPNFSTVVFLLWASGQTPSPCPSRPLEASAPLDMCSTPYLVSLLCPFLCGHAFQANQGDSFHFAWGNVVSSLSRALSCHVTHTQVVVIGHG